VTVLTNNENKAKTEILVVETKKKQKTPRFMMTRQTEET